jgi:hypothetical protein
LKNFEIGLINKCVERAEMQIAGSATTACGYKVDKFLDRLCVRQAAEINRIVEMVIPDRIQKSGQIVPFVILAILQ